MPRTAAYAALAPGRPLAPFVVERREPRERDVEMAISHCGVCHSDIHQARDEWSGAAFPMVPGHEIVGRVSRTGRGVTRFREGDIVGVGCMVNSCGDCRPCRSGTEQFCDAGTAWTYNGTEMDRSTPTFGGYSRSVVVDERFVLKMPRGLDPAAAAPLLCAGITTYSPLRQWNCKAGDRVAVAGLGGLGHVAVKLAAAMGAEVTVLSTSRSKEPDARRLGATGFLETRDPAVLEAHAKSFDLVLDTVSAAHDYDALLRLLRPHGAMVVVGVPPEPTPVNAFSLIGGNRRLAGSLIGGIQQTQEMLDFCGERGITADVEIIAMSAINDAYERMLRSDVRYRFVIDLATLPAA